ncbi:hypothetical protein Bca101_025173 [Brassica carinata]
MRERLHSEASEGWSNTEKGRVFYKLTAASADCRDAEASGGETKEINESANEDESNAAGNTVDQVQTMLTNMIMIPVFCLQNTQTSSSQVTNESR